MLVWNANERIHKVQSKNWRHTNGGLQSPLSKLFLACSVILLSPLNMFKRVYIYQISEQSVPLVLNFRYEFIIRVKRAFVAAGLNQAHVSYRRCEQSDTLELLCVSLIGKTDGGGSALSVSMCGRALVSALCLCACECFFVCVSVCLCLSMCLSVYLYLFADICACMLAVDDRNRRQMDTVWCVRNVCAQCV